MSGVSPMMMGSPAPLSAPSTMPLKKGDEDGLGPRPLRPTLSFRQKPEPPKLPQDVERTLRASTSFRQKPEPPRVVSFMEQRRPNEGETMDVEKQRQMQKTKSKIDMLSTLIREGSSAGTTVRADHSDSSDDDSSDDETPAPPAQGTGGRALIRPSAPPPPPPGLAPSDLPPLPKASINHPPLPPSMMPSPITVPAPAAPADDNASENWVTMWSPEKNRNYFYNKKTGASTWEDPSLLQSQTSPPSVQLVSPRANGLEKAIHKKTLEKPVDDEVDVFGRGDDNGGSRGSSGSSSGRMSLRRTLSRALGLSAKKGPSKLRGSDSGSDSHKPKGAVPPVVIPPANAPQTAIPPEPSPIFADNSSRGSMRSFGSMKSMTSSSAHSHDSETRTFEKPIHAKHVEVVAEVRTKAGRHTIVRAKKSKKKDHSVVIEEHVPAQSSPGVYLQPLSSPMTALGPTPIGQPAAGMPTAVNPQFQPIQQQGMVRTASSPHMPGPGYGAAHVAQHFGAPHPQHMGQGYPQPHPYGAYPGGPATPYVPQPQVIPSFNPLGMPGPQHLGHAAPPRQPQPVRYVQSLYDFYPSNPANVSEMSLKRGDVIQLVEQGADGWWEGIHCATGQRGLFPGAYVQFVQ